MLYSDRSENVDLEDAKVPGLDDRKPIHIANIDRLTIVQSRKLSLSSKSHFQSGRSMKKFLLDLQSLGTPSGAIAHQKYHKSSRTHWGVTNPDKRKLISGLIKELPEEGLIKFSQELWETSLFDPMICAALILEDKKVKPSAKLWSAIVRFLKDVDGWALEDTLAHAAWKCILADEVLLDEVETWTKHSDFWMRRAALVYTLPFAKPGKNPERSLKWASSYVDDREWFIQKAIGWWLRVLSEHNPKRVLEFVKKHESQLMYVAKKEATRKIRTIS